MASTSTFSVRRVLFANYRTLPLGQCQDPFCRSFLCPKEYLLELHSCQLYVQRLIFFNYDPLILVEYNIEQGNSAVPFPISYRRWDELTSRCGFTHTQLLHTRPSRFLREIYSAVSWSE